MTQKIFTFDATMLSSFQECAQRYKYAHVDNLIQLETPSKLEKGSLMHHMLEVYYSLQVKDFSFDTPTWKELRAAGFVVPVTRDFPTLQGFAIKVGRYFAAKSELPDEEIEETIYQFQEYTNYYMNDSWSPLAVEEVGSKILFENENLKLIYNFKVDLIAEKGNIIAPFDHKTTSRREEPSSMSNQFIGYCFGLGLTNIIINKIGFQKTLKPNQRFQRFILTIDDARIEEWRQNTIWWASQMIALRENNFFPRNLTSCNTYEGCRFRRVCEASPEAREWKIDQFFKTRETWDVAKELEEK